MEWAQLSHRASDGDEVSFIHRWFAVHVVFVATAPVVSEVYSVSGRRVELSVCLSVCHTAGL